MAAEARRGDLAFGAWVGAGLAVLIGVVYRDAFRAWFLSDDYHWLASADVREVLRSFVGSWGWGPAYRPLARTAFLLEARAFGTWAIAWHAASLALLVLDGTLLAQLLLRLSRSPVLAATASAVFVLLPLDHESAIWLSGQMHLIALALALGALLSFESFVERPSRRRLAACAVWYAAGLLTYEAAVVVVPLAILATAQRWRDRDARAAAIRGLAVLVVVTGAYAALRWHAVGGETLYPMRPLRDVASRSFFDHLATAGRTLVGQVGVSRWLLAAAACATAIASPRFLVAAALGCLAAAVAYAPFALVNAYAPRFFFMSGIGIAVALGALVAGVARLRAIGPIAAIALAATIAHSLIPRTEAMAAAHRAAGALERRVLEEVAVVNGVSNPPARVFVLGVPDDVAGIAVFYNSVGDAVRVFAPGCRARVVIVRDRQRKRLVERLARRDARRGDEATTDHPRAARPGGRAPGARRRPNALDGFLANRTAFLLVDRDATSVGPIDRADAIRWIRRAPPP
ncbi:MAG TPA: hypothetical protein VFD92_14400 [Candidatus Binatia bacterium]|nr:hypothetical protein [Candidatus Binatia bacterium]